MFDPIKFRGKTACVLGMARSGVSCANLLHKKGFKVLVSEAKRKEEVTGSFRGLQPGIRTEFGGHSREVLKAGFIVKSPGMLPSAPILKEIREKKIPLFSELETALAYAEAGRVFAVTGTNGKSTTTALLGEIVKASSCGGAAAGNIGRPVSECVLELGPESVLVLEVSSYQLEDSSYFRPDAASLLNVTEDHLDHHGSFERYVEAKKRIFKWQRPSDFCVFNKDDKETLNISKSCPSRRLYFSMKDRSADAFFDGKRILLRPKRDARCAIRDTQDQGRISLIPPSLLGGHNIQNSMAAALMALSGGIALKAVRTAFKSFAGLEHRLEKVGRKNGIIWVNDSKATNVESAMTALRSFPARKNILLILGGLDKGSPYGPLRPLLAQKARAVLTIGSAAPKIEKELQGSCPIYSCGDLARAAGLSREIGRKGDVLLLSPACASFDQFEDYEDRGRRFKKLFDAS